MASGMLLDPRKLISKHRIKLPHWRQERIFPESAVGIVLSQRIQCEGYQVGVQTVSKNSVRFLNRI